MTLHARLDGDIVILSNLARLMNDPRYSSAGGELGEWLDEGYRRFLFELRDVREAGAPLLGVLMTITRRVRQSGGEIVLVNPSPSLWNLLIEMQMEEYWDVFRDVKEAEAFFHRGEGRGSRERPGREGDSEDDEELDDEPRA